MRAVRKVDYQGLVLFPDDVVRMLEAEMAVTMDAGPRYRLNEIALEAGVNHSVTVPVQMTAEAALNV